MKTLRKTSEGKQTGFILCKPKSSRILLSFNIQQNPLNDYGDPPSGDHWPAIALTGHRAFPPEVSSAQNAFCQGPVTSTPPASLLVRIRCTAECPSSFSLPQDRCSQEACWVVTHSSLSALRLMLEKLKFLYRTTACLVPIL